MNYKKIIILLILFVAVAGLTMSTVNAASKTIKIQDKEWKNDAGYQEGVPGGKFVNKKYGNFDIGMGVDYQDLNKRWAMKYMPQNYFEELLLGVQSKKKFKSATFYLYDDKTGKYNKKVTLKAKYKKLYLNNYIGKGYRAEKTYHMDHRYICKKIVINY